jgi:CGNR zinc finger
VTDEIAKGVALAVELVNTRARPARPEDTLAAFVAAHSAAPEPGATGAPTGRDAAARDKAALGDDEPEPGAAARRGGAAIPPGPLDLDALRALREDLISVFAGDPSALNAWLVPPRLEPAATGFALRTADSLTAAAAYGLAALIAEHGLDRLGVCAASDCQCVYADTSPRGNRRFCSRTCSTRTNVRHHRSIAT